MEELEEPRGSGLASRVTIDSFVFASEMPPCSVRLDQVGSKYYRVSFFGGVADGLDWWYEDKNKALERMNMLKKSLDKRNPPATIKMFISHLLEDHRK